MELRFSDENGDEVLTISDDVEGRHLVIPDDAHTVTVTEGGA